MLVDYEYSRFKKKDGAIDCDISQLQRNINGAQKLYESYVSGYQPTPLTEVRFPDGFVIISVSF